MKLRDSKRLNKKGDNRGQVTLFIIIGITIVVLALILLYLNKDNLGEIVKGESPSEKIKNCIRDSIEEGMIIVSNQGGSINPQNYYPYKGNNVEYLCYTEENYKKCVVQKPLLRKSVEQELEMFLQPRAEDCIKAVKESLEKKGYSVSSKKPEINVELATRNLRVNMELDLKVSKDMTENYKTIKTDMTSGLYDLIMIASSIINWETRYGDSETMNYMMYYPSLRVEKKKQSDGTTIYILTDKKTSEKFVFASRSVAIPPGLTGN